MKIKETIKLIEKLLPLKENLNQGEINNFNLCISKLEKSEDEFAIKFAEWALDYSFNECYSQDLKVLLQ